MRKKQETGTVRQNVRSSEKFAYPYLHYFERSEIVRFSILSQFKQKLVLDKKTIEKEMAEFEKGEKG